MGGWLSLAVRSAHPRSERASTYAEARVLQFGFWHTAHTARHRPTRLSVEPAWVEHVRDPYSQLRPKPNRNARLAQLWKPRLVAAVSLATQGWNSPDANTPVKARCLTPVCVYRYANDCGPKRMQTSSSRNLVL